MDNELLISNIKNLCKANNIPISKLEKKLGFGSGLISRWNKADPSLSKIIDIANFFYVSIDSLVGRKLRKQEENFIPILLKLTQNKEITWKNGNVASYSDDVDSFEIFLDKYEILVTELNGGRFYLIAQYEYRRGKMDYLNMDIYIKPNPDSKPVLQDIEYDDLYYLWLAARRDLFGIPDEYKANKFISDFLSKYDETLK